MGGHHGWERDGRRDRSLAIPAIDQIITYIKDNEPGFSVSEKEDANREKEKTQSLWFWVGVGDSRVAL